MWSVCCDKHKYHDHIWCDSVFVDHSLFLGTCRLGLHTRTPATATWPRYPGLHQVTEIWTHSWDFTWVTIEMKLGLHSQSLCIIHSRAFLLHWEKVNGRWWTTSMPWCIPEGSRTPFCPGFSIWRVLLKIDSRWWALLWLFVFEDILLVTHFIKNSVASGDCSFVLGNSVYDRSNMSCLEETLFYLCLSSGFSSLSDKHRSHTDSERQIYPQYSHSILTRQTTYIFNHRLPWPSSVLERP